MGTVAYYRTRVGKEIPTEYIEYIVANSMCDVEFLHEQYGSIQQFRCLQNAIKLGLCEKLIIHSYEDLGDDELIRLEHWLFLKRYSVTVLMINPRHNDWRYHLINEIKSFFADDAFAWGVRHGDLLVSQFQRDGKKLLPFGYVMNEKSVIICEEEAKLVRELFRLYAAGEKLNKILPIFDGVLTRYGNPFSIGTLKMMVSSSKYVGIANKRQSSNMPGIVSCSDWFKVLRRIETERRKVAAEQVGPVFKRIFGRDRKVVYIEDESDLRYSPYAHRCDRYYVISSNRLKNIIVNTVRKIFSESDSCSLSSYYTEKRKHLENKLPKITAYKSDTERAFSAVLQKLFLDRDETEAYQEELDDLWHERYLARTRLRRLETEIELFSVSEESINSFFERALNLRGASFEEISYFANLLILRIIIDAGVAKLYYFSPNTGKLKVVNVSNILCELVVS